MRNAFNAWLFGIEEDVAKKYKSQARVWHAEIEECFLLPDFQNEGTFFYNQYNCFFAGSLPNWGEIPVKFISDQPK